MRATIDGEQRAGGTTGSERAQRPVHAFCSPQKGDRRTFGSGSWLGGADRCLLTALPSPAAWPSGFQSGVLSHSGGTAPDSHRTSLLCPSWAPKQENGLYHGPSSRAKCRDTFSRRPGHHGGIRGVPNRSESISQLVERQLKSTLNGRFT